MVNITSPVGRIVMGSLYIANTKDADGNPLVFKRGPDMGKPRVNYFFALAVAKTGEQHWNQTPWGQKIFAVGNQAFPGNPNIAWKIEDGDSQIPNKKGRKPCDNEGWRGHWILKLSGGYAPKVYRMEGKDWIIEQQIDYVKPGYFVEVNFDVDGNGSPNQPGIYLNHRMVAFRAYGQEIIIGPDVSAAGFGQAPLPTGASAAPVVTSAPLPTGASAAPVVTSPAPLPTPPVPVIPNVQFARPKVMTALANGIGYEAFAANGWTDEQLIQQGYMLP